MQNCKTRYKKTVDLNEELSPYTGSITCYDGEIIYDEGKPFQEQFVEISDCHNKVRIHRGRCQGEIDYVNKLIKMKDAISEYLDHLANNYNDIAKLVIDEIIIND